MNRRKALLWSLLPIGLAPSRLVAQAQKTRRANPDDEDVPQGGFRRAGSGNAAKTRSANPDDDLLIDDDVPPPPGRGKATSTAPDASLPAEIGTEPGQVFRGFDITKYTSLPHENTNPEDAIIEWIFRRTGSGIWHGDRIAVLSAGRAQVRAYHTPKVLKQVEEMIERFTAAQPSDFLKIRVRFVAAANPGWRYYLSSRLVAQENGPQGQQYWYLDAETAAMARTQMQVVQGFQLLEDQEIKMINGQTLTIRREKDVDYISGPQRDNAAGLGYQPGTSKLKEGINLRFSPLLTYEGDAIDVALDLQANTVKSLIPTKILTRREIGAADMSIDVPEVVETRFNRTIKGWKLGQTLMISAGIHPGVLQSKAGWFNMKIPGTYPTRTELLVFLDADTVDAPPPARTARRRDDREYQDERIDR